MMIVQDYPIGTYTEIPFGSTYPWNDFNYAYGSLLLFSDQELEDISLYRVQEATIPTGKISTGYHFERIAGVLTQILHLEDAPPLLYVKTSTIWTRLTENEGSALDMYLTELGPIDRGLFYSVTMLSKNPVENPRFESFREGMIAAFADNPSLSLDLTSAEERVDEILEGEF